MDHKKARSFLGGLRRRKKSDLNLHNKTCLASIEEHPGPLSTLSSNETRLQCEDPFGPQTPESNSLTLSQRLVQSISNFPENNHSVLYDRYHNLQAKYQGCQQKIDDLEQQAHHWSEVEQRNEYLEQKIKGLEADAWKSRLFGDASRENEELKKRIVDLEIANGVLQQTIYLTADSPRGNSRYTKVKVLLVQWESDDLGVSREYFLLGHLLKYSYGFDVSYFSIPDKHSHDALTNRTVEFVGDHSPNTLLIFQYSGHGTLREGIQDLVWTAHKRPKSPSMLSTGIQEILERSKSDTIIFYDACCSAVTSIAERLNDNGITELIAACGFDSTAPAVGNNSYTFALTRELTHAFKRSEDLTVSELFHRILDRMRNNSDRERKTTPVHVTLQSESGRRDIIIQPLKGKYFPLPPLPPIPPTHGIPLRPPRPDTPRVPPPHVNPFRPPRSDTPPVPPPHLYRPRDLPYKY